jgi:hypothetical protein
MSDMSRQEICWEEEYINTKCLYEFKLQLTASFNKEIPKESEQTHQDNPG